VPALEQQSQSPQRAVGQGQGSGQPSPNRYALSFFRVIEPGFSRALLTTACIDMFALAALAPQLLFSGVEARLESNAAAAPDLATGSFMKPPQASNGASASSGTGSGSSSGSGAGSHVATSHARSVASLAVASGASEDAAAAIAAALTQTLLPHHGVPIDIIAHSGGGADPRELLQEAALVKTLFGPKAAMHHPVMPSSYGVQHSKMIVLWYRMGVRVVVMTANLVPNELIMKNQGVWMQDFPYISTVKAVSGVGGYDNTKPPLTINTNASITSSGSMTAASGNVLGGAPGRSGSSLLPRSPSDASNTANSINGSGSGSSSGASSGVVSGEPVSSADEMRMARLKAMQSRLNPASAAAAIATATAAATAASPTAATQRNTGIINSLNASINTNDTAGSDIKADSTETAHRAPIAEVKPPSPEERAAAVNAAKLLDTPRESAIDSILSNFGIDLIRFIMTLVTLCPGQSSKFLNSTANVSTATGSAPRTGYGAGFNGVPAPPTASSPAPGRLLALIPLLQQCDFRGARVALVGSSPGAFGGAKDGRTRAAELYHYGLLRLRRVLSVANAGVGAWAARNGLKLGSALTCQVSSLGYGVKEHFLSSVAESLAHGTATLPCADSAAQGLHSGAAQLDHKPVAVAALQWKSVPSQLDRVQIVWPSVEDVTASVEGRAAGPWLLLDRSGATPALVKMAARWQGASTGRHRAMPHIKTYTQTLEPLSQSGQQHGLQHQQQSPPRAWWQGLGVPLAYVVLTSANLTQSAWGLVSYDPAMYKASGNNDDKQYPFSEIPGSDTNSSNRAVCEHTQMQRWASSGAAAPVHGHPAYTRQAINHFELGVVAAPAFESRARALLADGRLPPVLASFSVRQRSEAQVAAALGSAMGLNLNVAGSTIADRNKWGCVPLPAGSRTERPVVDAMVLQPLMCHQQYIDERLRKNQAWLASGMGSHSSGAGTFGGMMRTVPAHPAEDVTGLVAELAWWRFADKNSTSHWSNNTRTSESNLLLPPSFEDDATEAQRQKLVASDGTPGSAGPRAVLRCAVLAPLPYDVHPQKYSESRPPATIWTNGALG